MNKRVEKDIKEQSSKIFPKNFRAQSEISFGMIFTIILIVVFVAFAIYGINKFLEVQRLAQVADFRSSLQNDIDQMWKSTRGSQQINYSLPKIIKQVCFIRNRTNPLTNKIENTYFVPINDNFNNFSINNVDMTNTVPATNPKKLCINATSGGKISLIIKKDYNQPLVTITNITK